MNERIRALAEQATTKISFRLDPTTYKHIDDPEGDFERVEFDKQKFAELIVRECADICLRQSRSGWNDDRKTQARLDRDLINEHFGVEE
jgi:hypothetical protein